MAAEAGGSRRRVLLGGLGALSAGACHSLSPPALKPVSDPASLADDAIVTGDGMRLPIRIWAATDGSGQAVTPWAVVVGLHGMDDHSAAFTLPGSYWASRGVTTYAYDQRGFGRTADRGVWAGEAAMAEDLRTACALLRQRHPEAILAVVGESMGGAVSVMGFASPRPPDADRLVLASPAVWGWSEQGLANSALLWTAAHLVPGVSVSPPDWLARRIRASDNIAELRRMSQDRDMISSTRIDMIYGLVELMQHASDAIGLMEVPTLDQYGAHDQIIPRRAAMKAASRMKRGQRTAYYEMGWHLLLRDVKRDVVLDDILAFIRNPRGPLPSKAGPIPTIRS